MYTGNWGAPLGQTPLSLTCLNTARKYLTQALLWHHDCIEKQDTPWMHLPSRPFHDASLLCFIAGGAETEYYDCPANDTAVK